ncbi:hypothetical protein BSL78_08900 [Apostichopus japonicus]|uniref:HTH cro/C1-type domain-containing protein n=1 Tax=Stichopus japonicus TaxID=307972 RepID=A0A2G8L248_STIJA|nr:hypothetical protein BSL78_08900 [Apostichopus japonicus]
MMASHEGDEDAEIEAEIQRELDALNIEDLEDTLSSEEEGDEGETEELTNEVPECINQFILRVQSRTDDIQQEISECDALLSKVVEVTDEEKDEYFYQSKELKEFAFRIGEDPEELRDRVIQELAAEDEEDTKPLALEGPEVKVLALEGPLFEGRDDTEDGPVLALEGPSSGKPNSEEGNQLVLADPGTLEPYMEPIQRFEETAKRSVRDFEERFNSQLQEYKEDYEENQRSRVRREKLAEEDRARRRRENNEEQQRLAERRMIEHSKKQEKLAEEIEISRQYLDKYENDIKTLDAKTKEEKLAFLEERLEYQKLLAEKMSQSALKIQSVYRSYR